MNQLKPHIRAILAVDQQGAIGYQQKIPWSCPEDLTAFRLKTTGQVVVMGRNTALGFKGRPLPNRTNVIISNSMFKQNPDEYKDFIIYSSLQSFLNDVNALVYGDRQIWIIGGAQLYHSMADSYIDEFHIHRINLTADKADTFIDEATLLKRLKHHDTIDFENTRGLLKQVDIYAHR